MTDLYSDLTQLKANLKRQQELKNPGVQIEKRDPEKLLATIKQNLGDCQCCGLHTTRTHLVFGKGNPDAELMFVGEAPGADEDLQGEPFVGHCGNGKNPGAGLYCQYFKMPPTGKPQPQPR